MIRPESVSCCHPGLARIADDSYSLSGALLRGMDN
jgi:hypothetical protein